MSLMVWLPLNKEGDFNNRGLANITTDSLGTYDASGKIGGCYHGTTHFYINGDIKSKTFSICWWQKTTTTNFGGISFPVYVDGTLTSETISINDYQSSNGTCAMKFFQGLNGPYWVYDKRSPTGCWTINEWTHWACIVDSSSGVSRLSVYVNGILANNTGTKSNIVELAPGTITPHGDSRKNDIRIYDHCLSPKEVKEISKGLILHYPLNEQSETIYEGFSGTSTNWSATVSTEDLPSGATYSVSNGWMKYSIPINRYDTYEFKATYKGNSNPNGTYSYFSIQPFDIDGKFIGHHHCMDGFGNTAYWTTLTQDLNPGDTVLHCADLSNWTTGTNHYYAVAIMGYRDSTGYEYSDYTQDTPPFGSYTDKSHIDKTNNTLTLNSAYTGATRKAGTQIRQTTYGGTYYYPFYFVQANVTTWTDKVMNIIPNNINRLKYARTINLGMIYNGLFTKISWKNVSNPEKIYDCSGYGNDGTITGTLTINTDTPRYDKSTIFNGSTYITTPIGLGIPSNNLTVSCWVKRPEVLDSYTMRLFFGPSSGNNQRFYFRILPTSNLSTATFNVGFGVNSCGTKQIDSTWHHLVATTSDDGKTIKTYVDGELTNTYTEANSFSMASNFYVGSNFIGTLSDLRVYRTSLSPEDILELYNTSALIDNQGNDYCYEFEENKDQYNMLRDAQAAIANKTFGAPLHNSSSQTNGVVTLTDEGLRVYRAPNITGALNSSGTKNWCGFVITNTNNILNLQDGHTYIIIVDVKGITENAMNDNGWRHTVGWNYGTSGVAPQPSNTQFLNPVKAGFDSNDWIQVSYKWTINDGVYKVATATYQQHTEGNTYLSYHQFKLGWGYNQTGDIGTDMYFNNLRMFDITTSTPTQIDINKLGQIEAYTFTENYNNSFIDSFYEANANQLIEI